MIDMDKINEELKKASEEYGSDFAAWNTDRFIAENSFIAGAEWQKEQMMKDAIEGIIFQSEDYYPKELVATYTGDLESGDKVRIIIVKED